MEPLKSALLGCIFFRSPDSNITVVLGRTNRTGSNPKEVSQTISQAVCHPEFNAETLESDICLVKLSSPVELSDHISPVCLAAANSTFPNGTFSWIVGSLIGKLTALFIWFQLFLNLRQSLIRHLFFSNFIQALKLLLSFSFKSWEIMSVKITVHI